MKGFLTLVCDDVGTWTPLNYPTFQEYGWLIDHMCAVAHDKAVSGWPDDWLRQNKSPFI